MSRLPIQNSAGSPLGELEIADELLVLNRGAQALQDALVAYRAGLRAGTASTLTKGEVAGSNRKPWQQKGLGRARAGYRQSPIWRGGGVVFGPKPRSYRKSINRKVAQLAFRRAFSEKVAGKALRVLDALTLAEPKTKALLAVLKALELQGKVLIILEHSDGNIRRASRNLRQVEVALARDVHPYQLVRYPAVVVTKAALALLEQRLKPVKA
ncbi:MAG: 50S ribosomal protein L4 [Lentisphaerae bacterium]|nr:50S ribosomal protein L4 [Lentisphaerota bacterium]